MYARARYAAGPCRKARVAALQWRAESRWKLGDEDGAKADAEAAAALGATTLRTLIAKEGTTKNAR